MNAAPVTCIMLLSDKSSGSTALQYELAKHSCIKLVQSTRHNEQETLYWNKAAAVLGLPQRRMLNSELPIAADQAKRELREFLKQNLGVEDLPSDDGQFVFEGWYRLCKHYGPVFLEKSPHHLHYPAALQLISECAGRYPDVTFRFIGLVRNPIDTLYSMWCRWRAVPEVQQYEWLAAYRGLKYFQSLEGDRLRIINYESLVSDGAVIKDLCEFLGIEWTPDIGRDLKPSSIGSWRKDKRFGFRLAEEVVKLAQELGYASEDLQIKTSTTWPVYRDIKRMAFRAHHLIGPLRRDLRGRIRRFSRF